MIKLEFLKDGSPDCPLIRIFGGDLSNYKLLYSEISKLVNKESDSISVHNLAGFKSVNINSFNFLIDKNNIGVIRLDDKNFECRLKISGRQGWENVLGLIEPFLKDKPEGFQWLVNCSDIPLLISRDGSW